MSAKFGKVGVLYGGRSAEREVSLMSGAGVHQALLSAGVDAHLFDTGERSLAELAAEGFERVFIALHGRFGEDGSIQGALELLGIPYTGSGPLASALAMDKTMTKRVWLQHGLPTPEFELLDTDTELRLVPDRLSLPLIIKPPHEGSTVGITKVVGYSDMKDAYALAAKFDAEVLAEQFITGRELTVAVLGGGKTARAARHRDRRARRQLRLRAQVLLRRHAVFLPGHAAARSGRGSRRDRGQGLPGAGLRRLGPRRFHPRPRQPAVAA